ncbi:hypothetical protein Godav_021544 [Gossypium davidsonii]|uniref:Uncharacterized protein n=2 Tax=Gossypium TaxID=3633 RepID=A0A7J8R6S4_GOSDV|nr:hypothetical protein [Gossypium davidsonii]
MLESWGRKVANRVDNKERKGIRVTYVLEVWRERETTGGEENLQDMSSEGLGFAGDLDSETLCAFEEIKQCIPGHLVGSKELLAGISSA